MIFNWKSDSILLVFGGDDGQDGVAASTRGCESLSAGSKGLPRQSLGVSGFPALGPEKLKLGMG